MNTENIIKIGIFKKISEGIGIIIFGKTNIAF